ncbi:RagB/SusD family nutrient uptake outer membrane protein [Sinomicrobium kalidii]|uniref:RagB/SusD family nutrient uptake outer membrane protein n=1 Tax=Sinomicrobium kalidii TaxID=2900738 RepID=UPI001E5BD3E1|nr:RagB/SusD family nutrient uptake outer membrane protein [Sinomicrobium kalidii]UGU15315.1 RagB/SusD family nutrient uptake outer membrane protein [Sinomicrobium kalidii]
MRKLNQYKHAIDVIYIPIITHLGIILISGCTDFAEIDPPKNELVRGTVFNNEVSANAAMAGVYADMSDTRHFISGWQTGVKMATGQTSDEYNTFSSTTELFENEIDPNNNIIRGIWQSAYTSIYSVNVILEEVSNSKELSSSLMQQLEGEAKFIRAFNYFYLINLFGDVPIIMGTDFEENRLASRASVSQVYELVLSDLKKAKELLPDDYSHSHVEEERVRVNKGAAMSLLARVYLYTEDWGNAETEATAVINNPLYNIEEDLSKVFLADSNEAIWQLLPTPGTSNNAPEAYLAAFASFNSSFGSFTEELSNAFEPGDQRKIEWVGTGGTSESYLYTHKYKTFPGVDPPNTEYSIILRLSELYLVRAEARIQQDNLTGAISDLDIIRGRAGLPLLRDANPGLNWVDLMLSVEQERRVELFTEGGHRWMDLKRWGKVNEILAPIKPMWEPTDVLYPIPQNDLERNPNLTQNTGYPEF